MYLSKKFLQSRIEVIFMPMSNWIRCPKCNNKTRLKIREDTILKNFPLYCPKCRQEMLIDVQRLDISVITEPDAQTQSR